MTAVNVDDDGSGDYLVSFDVTPDRCGSWLDFKYETILTGLHVKNVEFVNTVVEYLDGVENSISATSNVQPFL